MGVVVVGVVVEGVEVVGVVVACASQKQMREATAMSDVYLILCTAYIGAV